MVASGVVVVVVVVKLFSLLMFDCVVDGGDNCSCVCCGCSSSSCRLNKTSSALALCQKNRVI